MPQGQQGHRRNRRRQPHHLPRGRLPVKNDSNDHGFAAVPLHCINGLPWAYDHDVVQVNERDAAVRAIEDFRDNVLPHVGPRRRAVLAADKNFHDQEALRPLGIVPEHPSPQPHRGRKSTEDEKEEAARLQFDLDGKPGWYMDGFREPDHRCGDGADGGIEHPVHVYRRVEHVGGRVVVRIEAECKRCETSVTITASQWKKVRDTARKTGDPRGQQRFTPLHPTDPDDVREWDFGNPLTYHDELAARYGDMRFGHGEGVNGTAVKRLKLFKPKGYLQGRAGRAPAHAPVRTFVNTPAATSLPTSSTP